MSKDATSSILWVVPKWPLPAEDGARIATRTLLANLRSHSKTEIDLVAIVPQGDVIDVNLAREELGVRDIHIVRRPGVGSIRALLSRIMSAITNPRMPLTMSPFATKHIRVFLNDLIESNRTHRRWNTIVYDGLHGASHSFSHGSYVKPGGIDRVVYRAHNRETDLWIRAARGSLSPLKRYFFQWQATNVRRFEDSLVRQSLTVPVSDTDRIAFEKAVPKTPKATVPIGFSFERKFEFPISERIQLLFIGRLDWPPNRDGLLWFLTEVWPEVMHMRDDIDLVIAGSGEGEWLKPLSNGRRTVFLGRVDSVEQLYAGATACIVPVFYGSGTRVKAIEASRYARACISTSLGVEGTGLVAPLSYINAETAKQWIDALLNLTPREAKSIGESAYTTSQENFDEGRAAEIFARVVGAQ